MTLLFADSAWPLSSYPSGVVGVAGYIGGDTPHVWSKQEWANQPAQYRLPIYVRSDPPGPGAAVDAAEAITQLKVIGCPKGSLVAWDMETAVDAPYISDVYDLINAAGYKLIVYGSSGVSANRNPDGWYWVARWDENSVVESGMVMHQYHSIASYDLSVADSNLPFWNIHSVDPPPDPPKPDPPAIQYIPASDVEHIMSQLPVLSEGMNDTSLAHWYVRRVQAILVHVYGQKITVDGNYGPQTKAAVESLQRSAKLTADGVVGSNTWNAIVAGS